MNYYLDTPEGRKTANAVTGVFCSRTEELGWVIGDYLLGYWPIEFMTIIFDRSTEGRLREMIPLGNLWWGFYHPQSPAVFRDWLEWFRGGRGPKRGWLKKKLITNRKPNTPSLYYWPGELDPFGPTNFPEAADNRRLQETASYFHSGEGLDPKISFSREVLKDSLQKYGSACFWCKSPFDEFNLPVGDHYIPRSHLGATVAINCRPACVRCNSQRGNLMPDEWRRKLDGILRQGRVLS